MSTRLRRKALQDFYHIQNASQENVLDTEKPQVPTDFEDDNQVDAYVTKAHIEDILALRNTHTDKLNLYKLSKKSIIYDNYSELIHLSKVLNQFEAVHESKGDDIGALLDDLEEFSKTKVREFNVDFKELLLVDDESSIRGTVNMALDDDINKTQMMAEISHLLESSKLSDLDVQAIDNILSAIDNPQGNLLRQQLIDLKRK